LEIDAAVPTPSLFTISTIGYNHLTSTMGIVTFSHYFDKNQRPPIVVIMLLFWHQLPVFMDSPLGTLRTVDLDVHTLVKATTFVLCLFSFSSITIITTIIKWQY
jgi:hypothetical protein